MNLVSTDRPVQVLVADDPCEWIRPIASQLHRASIRVCVTSSERQSLQMVRTGQVDLALVAGDVPHLGGLELVRRMYHIAADLPVILIGGRSDRHWLEEALRLRARTILPRPVNPVLLLEMIGKMQEEE